MKAIRRTLALGALASITLAAPRLAQCQVDQFVGSGPKLGWWDQPNCLATSGDTLAVGHPPVDGSESGFYVFVRSGSHWVEEAHLAKPWPSGAGTCLALQGDTLAVTDYGLAPAGGLTVYTRTGTTWSEATTLLPDDDPPYYAGYGSSMALSGDTLAVGAPMGAPWYPDDVPGRVYIYVGSGASWVHQATLVASDGAGTSDRFGRSLALEGDRLVVGAPQVGIGPGAVYEFERSGTTWSEVSRIGSPGPTTFGNCVALEGSTLAVGAGQYATGFPGPGVAYVYTKTGGAWVSQAALLPEDATVTDRFAWTLDLRGDRLIVGSPWEDHAGQNSGLVYVYQRQAGIWTERDRLYGDDTKADDWLGLSLAFTDAGEVTAMTVASATYGSDGPGKVYIFREDPACPTAAFAGSPTSGPAPLTVTFQDLSTGATSGPVWDFGDGSPPVAGVSALDHVYALHGPFDVSSTVGNAFGIDRFIGLDYVETWIAAKAIVRNGTGANPLCLASASLPVVGATWTAEVDASAHAGAMATFVAVYGNATMSLWSAFGEILILPPAYGLDAAPVVAGIGHHAIPIPPDPELVGLWVYTQGAVANGFVHLCNGVDLQFGQ